LSIKEDLNIYEVLIDSIREKTSASNEPIYGKCKLDFDKHSGQKLFLSFLKALQIFFISQNGFRKTRDTCHQHPQL
jgi:hypothetical protein